MATFAVGLAVFLLAMAGPSDAAYCVCNTGVSDQVLQRSIDYACGAGADCTAILQNGPCYNPDTIKDHCNYAVNSYYQRKGQTTGSCDFQGSATVTQTAPSAASGCVYQSSPSNGGSTSGTTMGGTPNTPGGTTTIPGSTLTPGGGSNLGPTGSGFGNTDTSDGTAGLHRTSIFMTLAVFLSFVISGSMI